MRELHEKKGTVNRYLSYLEELYDASHIESKFQINQISANNNVTRVIGTVVQEMGIIERHPTKRATYKWRAARPTITMARKVRREVSAYNKKWAAQRSKIQKEPNHKGNMTLISDISEKRQSVIERAPKSSTNSDPFFFLKIGRLEIKI